MKKSSADKRAFDISAKHLIPTLEFFSNVPVVFFRVGRGMNSRRKWRTAVRAKVFGQLFSCFFEFLLCPIELLLQVSKSGPGGYSFKLRSRVIRVKIGAYFAKKLNRYILGAKTFCFQSDLICKRWAKLDNLSACHAMPDRKDHPIFLDLPSNEAPQLILRPWFLQEVWGNDDKTEPGAG